MVVKLLALRTRRALLSRNIIIYKFLVLISVALRTRRTLLPRNIIILRFWYSFLLEAE
jgi:hypothetical protein